MSIIAQAPVALASTAIAAGTSAQVVQVSTAGVTAGLAAGNFVLGIPAEFPVGYVPIRVKAQGYIAVATTSTVAIGFQWGKLFSSLAATFTPVASASLTGANPPVFPTNVYPWAMEQTLVLDANSQTASAFGPACVGPVTSTDGNVWVAAAPVVITAGFPPTQLTSVTFNPTLLPAPSTGINQSPTLANTCLSIGISFTNGTTDTTGKGQFVITSFYALAD